MPEILDRCVMKVKEQGHDESSAMAICRSSLNMCEGKGMQEGDIIKMACDKANEMKGKKFSEPELMGINGVEIFSSGKWNGDKYTLDDLDKIVAAFSATKNKLKPFVKLGHSEKQELLKGDELPAAGWISNLYRAGDKLIADIIDMPKKIYELIKRKAYKRVSSELFVDIKVDGQLYPYALKGIALLGGETPAVNSLDDVLALYNDSSRLLAFDTQAQIRQYEFEPTDLEKEKKEKLSMEELIKAQEEIKKLSEANKALEEKSAVFSKEVEEANKKYSELQEKHDGIVAERKLSDINAKVDKLIQDKKIVPAQAPVLKEILANAVSEKKFKIGEKEFDGMEALIFSFVDASAPGLKDGEESEKGKDLNGDVVIEAKKYAEEHKVTFKEALIAISRVEKK